MPKGSDPLAGVEGVNVRDAFSATRSFTLMAADYSQIEVRVRALLPVEAIFGSGNVTDRIQFSLFFLSCPHENSSSCYPLPPQMLPSNKMRVLADACRDPGLRNLFATLGGTNDAGASTGGGDVYRKLAAQVGAACSADACSLTFVTPPYLSGS